jgi:hypothetical protein
MIDDGSGSKGLWAWAFSASAAQYLVGAVQLPHGWAKETSIYPHLHWAPLDNAAGNVRLSLEYAWVEVGGAMPANSTLEVITAAAPETTLEHVLSSWSPVSGVGHTGLSDMLLVTIGRQGADVLDTYGEEIFVWEMDFHVQIDRAGSGSELAS